MGLLDQFTNMSPDQTQGLLAAASQILQQSGDTRHPFGLGAAMGIGIEGYQTTMDALKRRKMQEDQAKMAMQMHGLQMQDMQGNLADKQRTRDLQAKIRDALAGNNMGSAQPTAPQAGGDTAPAMPGSSMFPRSGGSYLLPSAPAAPQQAAPAQSGGDSNQMLMDRLAREAGIRAQYGDDAGANALYEHIAKLRDEYATDFRVATGDDGKLHNYLVSKTGKLKDTGLGVKPNMVELGLGNRKQFIDTNTVMPGQQFMMGQSPDSAASNGLGWARLKNDIAQQGRPQFNAEVGGFISPPNAGAPNGTLTPLAGYTKPPKDLTESQGKASLFASRMDQANRIMTELNDSGTKTPSLIKSGLEGAPLVGGALGAAANFVASSSQQKLEQSQRDFVNAVLRQESGASISPSEFDSAKKQYFPQPGDSQEVVAQKAENRATAIRGMTLESGSGASRLGVGRPGQSSMPSDITDLLNKYGGK